VPNGDHFGPTNPHPLSTLRTELVWEGKYDEYGNRREVDIAGMSMPMQKIETVDQPRSEAAALGQLAMFEKQTKRIDDFRNMLIWGDNKLVMASLLKEFKGRFDLIYIDPPFDVGMDFSMNVAIGDENDTVEKDQSTLEFVAYQDTWGRGTDSYLHMMHERLVLIRDLLSDSGTLYVHTDWHVGHFLKSLCIEVFGKENFVNELTWHYYNKMAPISQCFPRASDRIISFAKVFGRHKFYQQYEKRDKPVKQLKRQFIGGKAINVRDEAGVVQYQMKDEKRLDDVWRLSMLQPADKTEYLAYSTQKPESLLERIISASSDPNDLVGDFFCGSGTTGAVAERLGRRWVMSDLGRFAIYTARKRLIERQRSLHESGNHYRALDLYNLGRYERQWWQHEALNGAEEEHRRVVLEFFQAEPLTNAPSPLIHGRKGPAFCHVDGLDSMFSRDEARVLAKAVAEAGGRECYCLAWEFEMDLRLTLSALDQEFKVKLKPIQIPREVMERNRKSPPPFLEMAVLEAEPVYRGKGAELSVDIKLAKFLPSLAEVPTKELESLKERAMSSGFDFIDFWAIDFDWHSEKPFNHHWQDYRTRKDRSLKTVSEAGFRYAQSGSYTACVKVVDVFGCDTSVTVEVKV
jgi:adenine-specific DNA-methyltransferase